MSVLKWKPPRDKAFEEFTNSCKLIYGLSTRLRGRLGNILKNDPEHWQDLDVIAEQLPHMMKLYRSVVSGPETSSHVLDFRCEFWQAKTWHQRLATLYLINQVVSLVLVHCVEDSTYQSSIIKFVTFFNDLLNLNLTSKPRGITVVKNTCPSLLQPLRRLSITKILQILAQGRAEQCGQLLVTVLLDLYLDTNRATSPGDSGDPDTEPLISEDDLPSSDNSSMEIYRTLTRYMTPPQGADTQSQDMALFDSFPMVTSDVALLDSLLYSEDKRLTPLLTSISQTASSLLGPHAIKQSRQSGELKVRRRVRHKVLEYYSQVLWGEVGAYLDHVLLWWGARPLGTQTCHHFRSWLHTFLQTVTIPDIIRPALHSLQDSLCCHVTSTSWDQLFRRALVAAGTQHSRHIVHNIGQGTYTGELFSEMFSDLVLLSNSCEGPNWTVQDLEELPVVEQIPVLHRLDHSVHTVRLWVQSRAKQLSNPWNMDQFFRVTQSDINTCLQVLSLLKFSNQVDILNAECSVHVVVCVKMRAKLVSEVKANLEKLQNMSTVVLDTLASVCRTVSLANLHMMFPDPHYWRQRLDEMPQFASNYVEDYLEEVLRPVLSATTHLPLSVQQRVSGMVLNIMCEAWLDHIYAHQIKFSEWGALQLLTDFGAVPTWLLERVTLSGELRKHLLNTEVLRRCEGVGRLLLRRPGERIPMTTAPTRKKHVPRTSVINEETNQLSTSAKSTSFNSPNDIGLYVDKKLTTNEKENLLRNAWKPEENFNFPSTEFGKRHLKFQYSWFKTREWLTYSKVLDGAFCRYCFLFSPTRAGKQGLPLGKLVRAKYTNWKHALEDFNKHQLTTYHMNCKVDAENFLLIQSGQSSDIVCRIDKGVKDKIIENRRLLTPVIKTVIFCGRQGLPLRGHRDGGPIDIEQEETDKNEGNFRALLRMRIESGDSDLKEHLLTAGKNATYTSSVAQNEIISACNQVILQKLVTRVNSSKCFSILADETTDVGCVEQLSLCARYVDLENVSVREDFLQFVPVNDLTGKGLSEIIMGKLRDLGINTDHIYGQGYDGASSMSGLYNGVQKFVKDQAPNALYVHCSSHSLNLAISSSCSSSMIKNCLGTVGKMYEFFNTPKRQAVLTKNKEAIGCKKKLKQLSPTRWIQRHDAVNVFCELFGPILESLDDISSWDDKDTATNAHLLHCAVSKCEFLVALFVVKEIFSYTLPLTKYLECEKIDLASAVSYAEHTATEIKKIRSNVDTEFSKIFQNVQVLCVKEDIPVKVPRLTQRQTQRENLPYESPESYFRRACFIPFIDHFSNQLNERFVVHKKILSSFEVLIEAPELQLTKEKESSEEENHIDVLFEQYGDNIDAIDKSQFNGEVKIWHQTLKMIDTERTENFKKDDKPFKKINAIEALAYCKKEMFPSVHKLLQIMATLPVTSCSAERSFSTLKYLKSYLRNTSSETRLNGLSLLYIHKDIVVKPEEVLDEMAKKSRRLDIKL